MMSSKEVRWTPKMFNLLVNKYVFRDRITHKFSSAISEMNENQLLNIESGLKPLRLLYEERSDMKEVYGSPEELMNDMYEFQNFPNNSEFFELGDCLNYNAIMIMMGTEEGVRFCNIFDGYISFVRSVVQPLCKFTTLIAKSIGNKILRKHKNEFKMISFEGLRHLVALEAITRDDITCTPEMIKHETMDDLFAFLSSFYSQEHDGELLRQLKKLLFQKNARHPIEQYPDEYEKICSMHFRFHTSLKAAFLDNNFTDISLYGGVPVIRLFVDHEKSSTKKLLFASEIRNIVSRVTKQDEPVFEVETPEERKMGIVRLVNFETYQNLMTEYKMTRSLIHMIIYEVDLTVRENQIPFHTPFGTTCVLAKHGFLDILGHILTGMKLFQCIKKENAGKVFEWLESIDVFDENRKHVYCVETWRIDQLIEEAYEKFEQFCTEPAHTLSKSLFKRNEVVRELMKFSPNMPNQAKLKASYEICLGQSDRQKFTARQMFTLYESSIFIAFVDYSEKYRKFLSNQGIGPISKQNEIERLNELFKNSLSF